MVFISTFHRLGSARKTFQLKFYKGGPEKCDEYQKGHVRDRLERDTRPQWVEAGHSCGWAGQFNTALAAERDHDRVQTLAEHQMAP
jgi:hypothetical protein